METWSYHWILNLTQTNKTIFKFIIFDLCQSLFEKLFRNVSVCINFNSLLFFSLNQGLKIPLVSLLFLLLQSFLHKISQFVFKLSEVRSVLMNSFVKYWMTANLPQSHQYLKNLHVFSLQNTQFLQLLNLQFAILVY